MSMTHHLSRALWAAALAASLATAGPAAAAERPAASRTDPAPTFRAVAGAEDPTALASPRRSIYSEVDWRRGRLWLRGDVESYVGGEVLVQRKSCESCTWRPHDVVRTGRKGWFRSVIGAPRKGSTFWRARVAASDGYSRSFSATWETYY